MQRAEASQDPMAEPATTGSGGNGGGGGEGSGSGEEGAERILKRIELRRPKTL